MDKLILRPTIFTPRVILDHEEHFIEISGESRPNDVGDFFGPIISWMNEYSESLPRTGGEGKQLVSHFNFNYFNSASAKCILDICKILARIRSNGTAVSVKWYYVRGDDDMMETGREMEMIVNMPFELIELENQ
ncbi:MAG: DUF1987 domain-containing protein [Bacteroidota bacterium]|jgi:hypothetical protein|nr:DUF1987 domain-containing protein [Bacteroidota bacterium]